MKDQKLEQTQNKLKQSRSRTTGENHYFQEAKGELSNHAEFTSKQLTKQAEAKQNGKSRSGIGITPHDLDLKKSFGSSK